MPDMGNLRRTQFQRKHREGADLACILLLIFLIGNYSSPSHPVPQAKEPVGVADVDLESLDCVEQLQVREDGVRGRIAGQVGQLQILKCGSDAQPFNPWILRWRGRPLWQ